jgi:TonB-linked SusC/RagA family outer membrane protein
MFKNILMTLLCLVNYVAYSQVTGVVKDEKTGQSVPGAIIEEKGTANRTITDENGMFKIKPSDKNAIITASYFGYDKIEIPLNGLKNVTFSLKSTAQEVGEVIVTALGLERKNKELGYAVQSLSTKEISDVKSPNFLDGLAGKVAGVTITSGGTGVGSSSKITIRGESSFTNNNPLFVIDGIIINNNTVVNPTTDAAAGFQEVDFGNGGMEINADDVASVTVLKGPSAAALYGTRASNGVIIITTKSGSKSRGLGISFNTSAYMDQAFRLPEFQNTYGQGNSGKFEFKDGLGGGTNDNITYSWGPQLDNGYMTAQFDSPVTLPDGTVVRGGDVAVHGGAPITPTEMKSNPDNVKDFYQTGYTLINNLSISNGFEKGDVRFSVTDMNSQSIIPGVDLKRKTISTKINFNPISRLKISSNINYINSNSDNRPGAGYGSENLNYSLIAWLPRSVDINSLKDYWQPGLEGLQQYSYNYTFFDNPYFILEENKNSFNRDRVIGNLVAKYDFSEKINLIVRTGMDFSNEKRELRRAYSSNRFVKGAYAEHSVLFRENNTDFLLNYKDRTENFSWDVTVGANRMDQITSLSQITATSLAQPGVYRLSNAATPLEINEYKTQKRINSIYSLIKLGYKNFLYLDITGRNDWSSALATPSSTENISFFYPSASLSLIVSNVVTLPKQFSFLKLRAGYAQVGNDTDPYQTSGSFLPQIPFNGQPTFSSQSTIANSNLLPERTGSYEIGADIRFFKDRLTFDVTYYNSLTKNQILSLPVAASSGYTQQVVNGGAVRSQGWEVFTSITAVKKLNFSWQTGFNFTRNISTVESLPEGVEKITLAYSRVYDNVNQTVWFQVEEGGRIGDMYGTGYKKNENGDFIIDSKGNYIADNNLKKLGNYNPDFMLGWSNNLTYKNFDLSFLFDWRQGGVLVSRTLALGAVGGQLKETEDRPDGGIVAEGVVNTGSDENPVWEANTTAISAESYYRQYYDRNHEENNTYNATYLKLRQFSIGYTFKNEKPKGFISENRTLKVSIIGRNLFALSAIPHFDPEQMATQGQKFVSGVEDMSYASTRSLGIKFGYTF